MKRTKAAAEPDREETPGEIAAIAEDVQGAIERAQAGAKTADETSTHDSSSAVDDNDDDQLTAGLDDELIEDLEDALGEAQLDLTSLRGDLRDAMLEQFKRRPKPWDAMLEGQKHDVVTALNNSAETIIQKIVRLIASAERVQVAGTLEQLTVKDGIKVTLKAPYSLDNLHALGEAQGKSVLIVVADAGGFMGERRKPKIEPDQTSLIPEDDGDLANAKDPAAGSPFGTESTGPAADVGAQAAADFAEDEAARANDQGDAGPAVEDQPEEQKADA